MAAVAFLSVLMPGLIRTVFGRELAFGALRCDAVHDSVPDSSNSLVKTLQNTTNDARLFHSLHQNPTAPSTIANWVAEKMAEKVKSEVN